MNPYSVFLKSKRLAWKPVGFDVDFLNGNLFDWQAVVARWAIKKGRAAIFEDTGLGKTILTQPMNCDYNSHIER